MLPARAEEAGERFPALISLDLGASGADESWLPILRAFPKLTTLVLGTDDFLSGTPSTYAYRLTDAGLEALRDLHLTSLDLSCCNRLTPEGIVQSLRGAPADPAQPLGVLLGEVRRGDGGAAAGAAAGDADCGPGRSVPGGRGGGADRGVPGRALGHAAVRAVPRKLQLAHGRRPRGASEAAPRPAGPVPVPRADRRR